MEKITQPQTSLKEIQPIGRSRCIPIRNRERIAEIVEAPLVRACEILYDKNIQTLESTANMLNIEGGEVGIVINFDSLSTENKQVAYENCKIGEHPDGYTYAEIKIPINDTSSVEEISDKASEIANRFQKQQMTWSPVYNIEGIRKLYQLSPEDSYPPESFDQFYYDKQSGLFYVSKEHFNKINNK